MKQILILITISTLFLLSCKITKTTSFGPFPREDSVVLQPPEGYNNPKFARHESYVSDMKKLMVSNKPIPCSQVQGLFAINITENSVSLFWTLTGAKQYKVYKNSIDAKGGDPIGGPATNNFIVTQLTAATTYWFSVAMIGQQGNKICDISEPIQVTTLAITPPQPPPPPPPSTGNKVIFFQFDTCTITGTAWNVNGPIYSPGSGMTVDEQQANIDYARIVYADHSSLSFTLNKADYDAADPLHRQMTVFTTNSAWYGTAGGVSYLRSFNNNTPNFVFTALLNYNVRNTAIAAVHEDGHALGLSHNVDTCTQSYGLSRLCCDSVWRAPVMGGSYTPYPHYFYTQLKGSMWCIKGLSKLDCKPPDEDAIIESYLK